LKQSFTDVVPIDIRILVSKTTKALYLMLSSQRHKYVEFCLQTLGRKYLCINLFGLNIELFVMKSILVRLTPIKYKINYY